MATKNNIRSIRFSDDLAELIDRQVGNNFQQKFETLITRCVWELPQKEAEIKQLDKQIARKRGQLIQMGAEARELSSTINDLFPRVKALENAIDRNLKKYEM